MDKLIAMEVFVTVVDCGSQSAAAEKLDLSRPVVSRYLAELEDWSGSRLLHRTTRRLGLTAAGSEMLPRCRQLLEMASDMRGTSAMLDDEPHGLLRITVSSSFAQAQMAQAVTSYIKQYPSVGVELLLLDRTVNLIDERIDLAIRITNDLDDQLIARQLSICRSVVCASPTYLRDHGTPIHAEELMQHQCLTHSYHGKNNWVFERLGEKISYPVRSSIGANEATVLMQAARAGAGVALLPTYLVAPYIRSGELVVLLPEYKAVELGIYGVYASRKHMPAALRTILDFLVVYFTDQPIWDTV
jgi:DNA-binding transcriptional LysR family regulator